MRIFPTSILTGALSAMVAAVALAQAPELNGGAPSPQLNGGAPSTGLSGGATRPGLSGGAGTVGLSGGAGTARLSGGSGLVNSAMLPGPLAPFTARPAPLP